VLRLTDFYHGLSVSHKILDVNVKEKTAQRSTFYVLG